MMKLDDVIFCYNKQYFTAHDVAGDGNCYYRALCLSPVIPIAHYRQVRDALCIGLRNILKYPMSDEYRLVTKYYSHCDEANRYSIQSYMRFRMCRDGAWGTCFEVMLTALIFDVQVITLANKPDSLWPFCTV